MGKSEYDILREEQNNHWRKRPQNQYKPNDELGNSGGYTEEYLAWQLENNRLNNAMDKERARLNAEQRAEENKVLSHIHVPKGLASKLALFGFNEKCYRSYYKRQNGLKKPMRYPSSNYRNRVYSKEEVAKAEWDLHYELYSPTYDQVALWFTEKYQVDFISSPEEGRKKQYRCDPITPDLGLVNLSFCNTAQEAQLQAFNFLLTKLKPLPKPQREEVTESVRDY